MTRQLTDHGKGSVCFKIGSYTLGTDDSWATTQTKMYEIERIYLKGESWGSRGTWFSKE